MTLIEFPIGGDGEGTVHVFMADEEGAGSLTRVGASERLVMTATRTWSRALDGMRLAAEGTLEQLRSIDPAPDEVEVTFGVAMDGKVGASIVSGGSGAHLNVKVVWKKPEVTKPGPG
ncbi:CU044_2847 family protein [Glycomyces harbinensis]|uniref:Trypsin-co-occurring domain-containing protein n=1 Tax=Glycomyces harbinensis TaxID=58114 RepID=A0A1G6WZL5_9ACTN|nr:CU044_2847 family protein [Glycomyces harbinensis]SDD70627.1 hypothetical protein SAMN05216270_106263 [Glycomyces harbinensis]